MTSGNPDLPCAINWSEGMLLSPQHFQQFDRYVSAQDYFWASAALSETCGILLIDYDKVNFSQGIFRITKLKAVFPDGALFDYQPGVMGDLFIDFSELSDEISKGPIKIAVQVPRSTDASLISEDKRFLTGLSTQEADETLANNDTNIERKFLNVRLGLSHAGSSKYSEIPIAEFYSDGSVVHFTNYHPRAFRLLDDFHLKQRVEKILKEARHKLIFLSDYFQGILKTNDELPSGPQFLAFRVLSQSLPELEAYFKQNRAPADIFAILTRLSGGISFLKNLSVPPNGSEFNTDNLTASFEPHLDLIESSLAEIQRSYSLVDLDIDKNVYSIDLANYNLENKVLIAIENQAGLTFNEIAALTDQAVIGDTSAIAEMRRKRTLGAKRKLVPKTHIESLGLDNSLEMIEIDFDGSLLLPKSRLEIRFQTDENQSLNLNLKLFLKL